MAGVSPDFLPTARKPLSEHPTPAHAMSPQCSQPGSAGKLSFLSHSFLPNRFTERARCCRHWRSTRLYPGQSLPSLQTPHCRARQTVIPMNKVRMLARATEVNAGKVDGMCGGGREHV